MGTGKLWGSEKGVFREGRIAGESDAAGAGTEATADCAFSLGAGVPDGMLGLALIDCCVAWASVLLSLALHFLNSTNESAERWFMPEYSRRTWKMVRLVLPF